jgi:hypothetical protein
MAPPIVALTGIGAVAFYQAYRRSGRGNLLLPLAIAVTGAWAFVLLRRTPGWNPWLPWTIAAATAAAVLALALALLLGRDGKRAEGPARRRGRFFAAAGVASLIGVLAGPAAYAVTPLSQTIAGSNPVAGPTAGGAVGAFPGGLPGFGGGLAGGRAGFGGGLAGGRAGFGGGTGRYGGRLGGAANRQMIAYLEAHRDGATWLVAVQGSSAAATIILETGGIPVMAMGGFRGTDPAPTLAQLEQYVKQGKLHYVLAGGGGGFGGGGGGSVISWVEQNCTAVSATGTAASGTGGLYHCG